MKAMKCEMCGSNDIIKQDGFYICQACGTKYTVEEAKKLMIEGTIKIDNSQQIKNYISLAKSSLKSKELKNCLKYCNMALECDSKNSEALKIKAQYYSKIKNGNYDVKDEINTLKSVSNSGVIDDEKIELLFSYIHGYDGFEYTDWFVSRYCDNEIIDIKNKQMATKLFKYLIRHCMRDILKENPDKTIGEIIKDFDNVPNNLIDTFKYKVDVDFDIDEIDIPDINLMIKVLIKKLNQLDNNYKYTDDELIIYNKVIEDDISYLITNNNIERYGSDFEYYKKSLEELNSTINKIKRIDSTYSFSKDTQEKINTILKNSIVINNHVDTVKRQENMKSNISVLIIIFALVSFVLIFVCLFNTNFKGAGICVLLFAIFLIISNYI